MEKGGAVKTVVSGVRLKTDIFGVSQSTPAVVGFIAIWPQRSFETNTAILSERGLERHGVQKIEDEIEYTRTKLFILKWRERDIEAKAESRRCASLTFIDSSQELGGLGRNASPTIPPTIKIVSG